MASYAVQFSASNHSITYANNSFDGLSTGTIEVFFKSSYTAAFQKMIFKNGCIDIGITQNFGGGAQVFGEIGGVANLGIIGTGNNADGSWHHAAFSWDGSFLRGYVDGVYKGRAAQGGNQNTNSNILYLGLRENSEPFVGYLDEFQLSNTARYTTETSFSLPTVKFTGDANTLILNHFDDGTGTSAVDSSGNGNTGTLNNGVSWAAPGYFADDVVAGNDWPIFTGKKFWGPRYT